MHSWGLKGRLRWNETVQQRSLLCQSYKPKLLLREIKTIKLQWKLSTLWKSLCWGKKQTFFCTLISRRDIFLPLSDYIKGEFCPNAGDSRQHSTGCRVSEADRAWGLAGDWKKCAASLCTCPHVWRMFKHFRCIPLTSWEYSRRRGTERHNKHKHAHPSNGVGLRTQELDVFHVFEDLCWATANTSSSWAVESCCQVLVLCFE